MSKEQEKQPSRKDERHEAQAEDQRVQGAAERRGGQMPQCDLREKMLTRLLGRKERVMILIPGNTVESLDITELADGGAACE